MNLSNLYLTMLTLFATIGIGFCGRKIGLLDTSFSRNLSNLILYFAQPFLVLSSVLGKERSMSNSELLFITCISLIMYVTMIGLSIVVPRLLNIKKDKQLYSYLFAFSNVGFMGYPVVGSLFGDDALIYVTIFLLFFHPFVLTIGTFMISNDKKHIAPSIKTFMKPAIIATVMAYLIYLVNIRVPTVIAEPINYIGSITTPLSMILIGLTLADIPIGDIFKNASLYVLCGIKMVVVPVVAYWILGYLIDDPLVHGILVVILAMPCATNATILSVIYNGNTKLASSGVFFSTALSVVTIPLVMYFLFG